MSQEAKFVFHKDVHDRESTLARVVGGQGMRIVLRFEQIRGGEGGPAFRTGYRIPARES